MRCPGLFGAVALAFVVTQGAAAQTPSLLAPYAQPQTLVALPDGRKINLVCQGQGSPAVILTAGAGAIDRVVERYEQHTSEINTH
jgi:hypothetical protein